MFKSVQPKIACTGHCTACVLWEDHCNGVRCTCCTVVLHTLMNNKHSAHRYINKRHMCCRKSQGPNGSPVEICIFLNLLYNVLAPAFIFLLAGPMLRNINTMTSTCNGAQISSVQLRAPIRSQVV